MLGAFGEGDEWPTVLTDRSNSTYQPTIFQSGNKLWVKSRFLSSGQLYR